MKNLLTLLLALLTLTASALNTPHTRRYHTRHLAKRQVEHQKRTRCHFTAPHRF